MEITATTKYVRMSPTKARDLANEIKGLSVSDALFITEFNARKAALQIGKTLKSAIANAEHNEGLSRSIGGEECDCGWWTDDEAVSSAGAWICKSDQKKTSHITIILSDQA